MCASQKQLETTIIYEATDSVRPFGFVVSSSSNRNYFLFASSREEMLEWTCAIRRAIHTADQDYFSENVVGLIQSESLSDLVIKVE